ncbi:ABC transporter permease [candidate division KSB1 bacterium]
MINRLAPLITLAFISLGLSLVSPHFLTTANLFSVGLQISVVAIMALGGMMVIIAGGIDLSVGSVLGLTGVISTMIMVGDLGVIPGVTAGVLAGLLLGFLNGVLVAWGRVPPFIATLGMMGMARSLALVFTGGVPIHGLPRSFTYLGSGSLPGGLPFPVLILLIMAGLCWLLLSQTRFGRAVYAVGGSMEASLLSGISVKRVLIIVYSTAGLLSGLAGVILASRLSTGQPTAGTGYELDVIAACVIGGASLTGGRGGILGALVGALLIGILRNGCNLLDISAFWQQFAIGAIIVLAVLFDQLRQRRGLGKLGGRIG